MIGRPGFLTAVSAERHGRLTGHGRIGRIGRLPPAGPGVEDEAAGGAFLQCVRSS